jgi:hypothetical protein
VAEEEVQVLFHPSGRVRNSRRRRFPTSAQASQSLSRVGPRPVGMTHVMASSCRRTLGWPRPRRGSRGAEGDRVIAPTS